MMDPREILARRLRAQRLEKGLSQERLGVLAGIDEYSASARMNQYEKGKHVPDLQTVQRLADVLEVPVSYFYETNESLLETVMALYALSEAQRCAVREAALAAEIEKRIDSH